MHALAGHTGAPTRGGGLPEDGPCEKQCLAGAPETHPDELGEKDAKAQVQLRGRGHLNGHGDALLLQPRMGGAPSIARAGVPWE
jgi:hypothetical protein